MNTLKTRSLYFAMLLLFTPSIRAQGPPGLPNVFKKATGTTKGKTPAIPKKDSKPAVPTKRDEAIETQKKGTKIIEERHVPPKVDNHNLPKDAMIERRPNGAEISRRADGNPRDVHVPNRAGGTMDIHHGLVGGRRVEASRADGSRVVADGARRGYVERSYVLRGREFGHRTYFVDGRAYDRFYGRREYRGAALDVYAPVRYYPAAFYGWAYNTQWAAASYAWGWAGNPWYAYYGAYFTPYPVYAAASFWLTDYLISQSLAGAYQAQLDAQIALNQSQLSGQMVLTPDVKQAIVSEVQNQIQLEYAEAQANSQNAEFDTRSSSIERLLSDRGTHIFVVGNSLDLVDTAGQECALTEGDVLQFDPAVAQATDAAVLLVMASKGGVECRRGLPVTVSYTDLQEMQNHMRETVDAGLAELQAHQNGLPALPPLAAAPATPATFENGAPKPEAAADVQIGQQYQEGSKAEPETLSPASASGTVPAGKQ